MRIAKNKPFVCVSSKYGSTSGWVCVYDHLWYSGETPVIAYKNMLRFRPDEGLGSGTRAHPWEWAEGDI